MANLLRYSYKASIEIKADKPLVWATLVNLQNYHLWNPFTPKVETDWNFGEKVILTVQMKKGNKPIIQTEYLSKFAPKDELAWGMNWGPFLKAERIQRITAKANGITEYFTEDVIEGLLSPIVHLMYGKYIQSGFDSLAVSLKKYTENS